MDKESGENMSCPADVESSLRDRIAYAIAAHEPVTDHEGADGECIECDLNPRWPDAPILPPSDGWKRHSEHLAVAVIRELEADYILVPKGHTIARIRSAEKLGLTGDGE